MTRSGRPWPRRPKAKGLAESGFVDDGGPRHDSKLPEPEFGSIA